MICKIMDDRIADRHIGCDKAARATLTEKPIDFVEWEYDWTPVVVSVYTDERTSECCE